jgi:virginiamycin B lyase
MTRTISSPEDQERMRRSRRRLGRPILASVLASGLLLAGCHNPPPPHGTSSAITNPSTPKVDRIRFRPGAFPRFLNFSSDGMLWITEDGGHIARLDRAGHLTHYRIPGSNNSPGDIVQGSDGAMWFSGFEEIGRIDANGRITLWELTQSREVGLPDALTAGPDGALWYTSETGSINRISTSGTITGTTIPSGEGGLYLAGITSGPDGAMWFTQSPVSPSDPPDAIGRLTADGHYTSWPLRKPRSQPRRITVGPDQELWFTEGSHRIGRITTRGVISEFPLPPTVIPFDITPGADRALWFTTDTKIGRITTSGRTTFWPIPGAKSLIGITAARDGSFWLADGEADSVWHFIPPPTQTTPAPTESTSHSSPTASSSSAGAPLVDVHQAALAAARRSDAVGQQFLADVACPPPPRRRTGEAVLCRLVARVQSQAEAAYIAVRVVDAVHGKVETDLLIGEIPCSELPTWELNLVRQAGLSCA